MTGERLSPDSRPVELKELGFVIVSDTVAADITTHPGSVPGVRSGGAGLTSLVLQSAGVREMGTVILQEHHPERAQEKSVTLYTPGGGSEDGRLLLYFDEDGGVSFHVPQIERRPLTGVRAGQETTIRFEIPIRKPIARSTDVAPMRGIGGMIAKKVLKVIGWKVLGMAARQVGPPLMRLWENKYRPVRVLNREALFVPQAESSIEHIPAANHALLFIHGTLSRVAHAFSGVPEDANFLSALHGRYGERIYGFDHPTLATGVATNVMQFYEKLSPGVHSFDIICHSRGGLVARALRDLSEPQLKLRFAEDARRGKYESDFEAWGEQWRIPDGVQVKVNRIFFAATPNNGTIVAQPIHLQKYLETLMTATNVLPEVVDVTVDAILATAKLLLTEVMPQLPGLDDQQPESSLLPLLQGTPGPGDAAVQADYAAPDGLHAIMRLADSGMDYIFGGKKNDLVVPTEGVSRWRGGNFPRERQLVFTEEQSIHHFSLFRQPDTRHFLISMLTEQRTGNG